MYSIYGEMLNRHFVEKFRENFAKRKEILSRITTREEAEKYVKNLQEKVKKTYIIPEKCDLNPRITGRENLGDLLLEKIIIDSRENYPVTMSLYLPSETKEKSHTAILLLCGHADNGKGSDIYRTYAMELARRGCLVLMPDPLGQGERYENDMYCCSYHNFLNISLKAVGDHFGSWRLNDAVRSLDYLFSRPEVDASRVAVTGNSGGGTMTTILHAYDERLAASAPCCYITKWVRNVENELPVDAEQIPPRFAMDGGEMADLLLAQAPRPVLISGNSDDFFDIRGTKEVYEEVKSFYKLLGAEENVSFSEGPGYHGLNQTLRENAYEFFHTHLGILGGKETIVEVPPEKMVFCTPEGAIRNQGFVTSRQIIAEKAEKIALGRKQYSDAELKDELKKLFHIGELYPVYRRLRPSSLKAGEAFSRYLVEEAGDDLFCVLKGYKKTIHNMLLEGKKACLYVPHQDSGKELAKEVAGEENLYGVDYRGVGECCPNTGDQHNRDFFASYLFDYHYDSLAFLKGESLVGGRIKDVMRCVEILFLNGTEELTLTASGIGIIPALFAAFLTERNVKLEIRESIPTYLGLCRGEALLLPQSMTPEGILHYTDLDDIAERLRKMGRLAGSDTDSK